jgi:hypothetical protein
VFAFCEVFMPDSANTRHSSQSLQNTLQSSVMISLDLFALLKIETGFRFVTTQTFGASSVQKKLFLTIIFATTMLPNRLSATVPVPGDGTAIATRTYVASLPTNPPPVEIKIMATEPTVYTADAAAPTGAYKIYTGFAERFPSEKVVHVEAPLQQRLYLIGWGAPPNKEYNEITIANNGPDSASFKVTLSNYFVFPNGRVEAVAQVVYVEPGPYEARANGSQQVASVLANSIGTQFSSVPRTGGGDNIPTNPPASGSNVHAVIITGSGKLENAVNAQTNTTLVGGVIALGSANKPKISMPTHWSGNLTIAPDLNLLNGSKIPPITPNFVDVRIQHYSVEATIDPGEP